MKTKFSPKKIHHQQKKTEEDEDERKEYNEGNKAKEREENQFCFICSKIQLPRSKSWGFNFLSELEFQLYQMGKQEILPKNITW